MREKLMGRHVRIFVDEGSSPLEPGMEIAGVISDTAPKTGEYRDFGVFFNRSKSRHRRFAITHSS